MKKQRKKLRTKSKNIPVNSDNTRPKPNRRHVLKNLRNGMVGVAVLATGGYFAVNKVQATIAEHDLTKIGNGKPAIVQIHDPLCSICRALQREARDALGNFKGEDYEYLVANIRSKEGSALANKYFVPHVTLLLFDGKGELVKVLSGPNKSAFLQVEFAAHLAASQSG